MVEMRTAFNDFKWWGALEYKEIPFIKSQLIQLFRENPSAMAQVFEYLVFENEEQVLTFTQWMKLLDEES